MNMIINDGIPVEECFYSDFAEETKHHPDMRTTSYKLHVYDATTMVNTYQPDIDNDTVYKRFMKSVSRQIAMDGVAIVLITSKYGKSVYIVASDD